jgi:GAF domain-containing protein
MTNPDIVPWRGKALRYHFNSVIALPLTVDDTVIGALTIHAAETGSFGAVEAMLLTEVVAALASGIVTVRSRSGRTRLGASLQRNEERFRAAAEASPDGLFLFEGTRRGLSGRTS